MKEGLEGTEYFIPTSSGSVKVNLREVEDVFEWGMRKHKDKGFELGTVSYSQHFYACLRHLWRWFFKHSKDGETARSHLAHAMCRILMIMYQEQNNVGKDDRK